MVGFFRGMMGALALAAMYQSGDIKRLSEHEPVRPPEPKPKPKPLPQPKRSWTRSEILKEWHGKQTREAARRLKRMKRAQGGSDE